MSSAPPLCGLQSPAKPAPALNQVQGIRGNARLAKWLKQRLESQETSFNVSLRPTKGESKAPENNDNYSLKQMFLQKYYVLFGLQFKFLGKTYGFGIN